MNPPTLRAAKLPAIMQIVAALGLMMLILFSLSYCQELPKRAFEREAQAIDTRPGTRLIRTMETSDLASPLSWFYPNKTTWIYAFPDAIQSERFGLVAMHFEYEPSAYMADADCNERRLYFAGLDEPESAPPMRDFLGRPVTSGDGRVFRLISDRLPLEAEFLPVFCDTDWSAERAEIRAQQG
jgi:hypothetical protein